jgi:ankyrin repeat protein
MAPPELPLELLSMIAHQMRDDNGELRYGDFNSFLQVNRALHSFLNRKLWEEAAEHELGTQRVLTHLIETNNSAGLEFFLGLGADVEAPLPAIDMTRLESDIEKIRAEMEIEPFPLLVVADLDNVLLARILLEKGAHVQYSDVYGDGMFSPLHAARSAEMVQLLLDYGADPDLDDEHERRPLHWHAIRDEITAMRALLQHGADVNPIGPMEKPLHEAAQRNLATVELLMEYGADVRARDLQRRTPLHLAALAGKIDVVELLVERWPEGMQERSDLLETPLHLAASAEKTNVVKFLAKQWPEAIRAKDDNLDTPLHCATSYSWRNEVFGLFVKGWPDIEAVELLLEGWPEAIKEKNRFGDTPLHRAGMTGKTEVLRFLLERWPEGKEAINDEGQTPLVKFELYGKSRPYISDKDKEEVIALLGGPYVI